MNTRFVFICLLITPLTVFAAMMPKADDSSGTHPQPKRNIAQAASPDPGERIFAANCARCHMPPTSLSPRITGTILMHMRVRARLSREDEKLLLKFMAP